DSRTGCSTRIFHSLKRVQPAEECHLDRTSAVHKSLQVVSGVVHPHVLVRRVQIAQKGELPAQAFGGKARRREEVEVLRSPMAKLQRQTSATIQHKLRWHG